MQLPAGTLARLSEKFLQDVCSIPDGEKIKLCLQCGTCSASCPTSYAMDYTPRQIIAAFRAGMLDRVLKSNTVWMCASCYSCTVRCPSGIKLTDIMYELKRLGTEYGLYARGATAPVLSREFVKLVDKYGRNAELSLLTTYYLKTNPFGLIKMAPLGYKLFKRGRLSLRASRIKRQNELATIMKRLASKEGR
ncbi:MAG: 4Fe-4S dicluster domain-containing protein [Candidatus Eisenbacteria bacterium]